MEQINKIEYTNLKIDSIVKKKFDKIKGRSTYSKWLDDAISFFEMNSVDPKHYHELPPSLTIVKALNEVFMKLEKRDNDIIKIIRSIETKKIDPLINDIRSISPGGGSAEQNIGIGPEEMEVLKVIEMNETLRKEVSELKGTISKLNESKVDQRNEVSEILEDLLSDKHLPTDNEGNLIMSQEFRQMLINKIRQ